MDDEVSGVLIKMSWRNIWRNKRRTLITAASVAMGIFLSVTFTATGDFSYTNIINTGALMGSGHVTIEAKGYNKNPSLDKRIDDGERIRSIALKTPGVKEAVVRISGRAVFSTAVKTVGGLFIAIDPKRETGETNFFLKAIKEGEVFRDKKGRYAVIGAGMAEKLKLRPGKKLIYTVSDLSGDIVADAVRVTGIFRTGVEDVDSGVVLLPLDRVGRTLGYAPGEATGVAVFILDQRRADEVRERLAGKVGGGVEVLTWKKTRSEMAGVVAMDRGINYIFQFLIGLIIAAGILNTILMGVLERKREFGIMVALGFSPARLISLVLLESFWIALAGLIAGIIITAPWYAYMSAHGINFSGIEGASAGMVPIEPVIKFKLYRTSAMAIISAIFTLTLASGLYPAFKASRTNPVESIKY